MPGPLEPGATRRRLLIAAAIYLVTAAAFLAVMPLERLLSHSPYNHYALQAEAWLEGRLDLGGPPPAYTGNNDFALHQDKHYVSFPPVPAALLVPFVALAGSAERVRDAQIFACLAPLGPALFFLALERYRHAGRSRRRQHHGAALALLLGLGTVYWFSAVQGSVWFAGHVVTLTSACAYLYFGAGAQQPLLAGTMLALGLGTRPTLAFAFPLFCYEAYRWARGLPAAGGGATLAGAPLGPLVRRLALFAAPIALMAGLLLLYNQVRFSDPTEFGHRLLTVVWRKRIDTWGLFSWHYLGRNAAVVLTGLPFHGPDGALQINAHGLALWLTTPIYLWALWPRRTGGLYWAAAFSALAVAVPNLLYQNTGWIQFGYRFSNDFAPFLFLMIAVGARPLKVPFWLLAVWSLLVNGFGAVTFGNSRYAHCYYVDRTQRVLHQPD
jgi:hypothetical protein